METLDLSDIFGRMERLKGDREGEEEGAHAAGIRGLTGVPPRRRRS